MLRPSTVGILIDRWGDIIEDQADITEDVRENFLKNLAEKRIPGISPQLMNAYVSLMGEARPYVVATTDPGVRCLIYISRHGVDLYVSWRTYVKGILNRRLFMILAGLAVVPGILYLIIVNGFRQLTPYQTFDTSMDLRNIVIIVVVAFMIELVTLASWGQIIRNNIFAYFFLEPTIFDAENISALSLAVHKTLKKAVAAAGADVSSWDRKTTFQSGRFSEHGRV